MGRENNAMKTRWVFKLVLMVLILIPVLILQSCEVYSPSENQVTLEATQYIHPDLGVTWSAPQGWKFEAPGTGENVLVYLVKNDPTQDFQANVNLISETEEGEGCQVLFDDLENTYKNDSTWSDLEFKFETTEISAKTACRLDMTGFNEESNEPFLAVTQLMVRQKGNLLIFTFVREAEYTVSAKIDEEGFQTVFSGLSFPD